MPLNDAYLTLREAQEFLGLNGVHWSHGWVKMQVLCGKIPSTKIYNSRVISKMHLLRIIQDHKDAVQK